MSPQSLKKIFALGLLGLAVSACAPIQITPPPVPVRTAAVADFNTCAKPVWPKASLRNEETGTVTLSFLIGVDGRVADSKLVKSSGFRDLDTAALEGVSKCRFKPATVGGKPEQAWMQMQYVWTIDLVKPKPLSADAQTPVKTAAVADFNSCPRPVYPPASLRNGETGTVTLAFLVSATGRVLDSNVVKSAGFRDLDLAAQEGISKCRFKPLTVDGKPEQAWVQMQYVWTLTPAKPALPAPQ